MNKKNENDLTSINEESNNDYFEAGVKTGCSISLIIVIIILAGFCLIKFL
jgi:hypothetical protein